MGLGADVPSGDAVNRPHPVTPFVAIVVILAIALAIRLLVHP